jgi:predicted acylesterase/phospholipase RssA
LLVAVAHTRAADTTPLAGASAGSLIAAALASGRPTPEARPAAAQLCVVGRATTDAAAYARCILQILDALKVLTADLRLRGTRGRLRPVLEGVLRDLLPADIADRARGRVHVAVTRITPPRKLWPLPRPREVVRGMLITDFEDKEDFIAALLASCYIRALRCAAGRARER